MFRFENPQTGPRIAAFAMVEACGGIAGGVVGADFADGDTGETTEIQTKINDIELKINYEQNAVSDLKGARPDSQPAIDEVQRIIGGQREQITALQGQQQNVKEAHPYNLAAIPEGAAIGMLAVALALTARYGVNRLRRHFAGSNAG